MEILGYIVLFAAILFGGAIVWSKVTSPLWPRFEWAVELAVAARHSTLKSEQVLAQLNNFMTREDKTRLEVVLYKLSDFDLMYLFVHPDHWEDVYTRRKLNREERAVLDEFLEDVNQILADDPF